MRLLSAQDSRPAGAIERDRGIGIRPLGRELECGWLRGFSPFPALVYHEPSPLRPRKSREPLEPARSGVPRVRRVQEHEVERAERSRRQLDPREISLVRRRPFGETEPHQVFPERARDGPAPLDERGLGGATAQRLDPERPGPRVEVEDARPLDRARPQYVEDRLARPVRGGTHPPRRNLDLPPAKVAPYDADRPHGPRVPARIIAIRSATCSGVHPSVSTPASAALSYPSRRASRSVPSLSSSGPPRRSGRTTSPGVRSRSAAFAGSTLSHTTRACAFKSSRFEARPRIPPPHERTIGSLRSMASARARDSRSRKRSSPSSSKISGTDRPAIRSISESTSALEHPRRLARSFATVLFPAPGRPTRAMRVTRGSPRRCNENGALPMKDPAV